MLGYLFVCLFFQSWNVLCLENKSKLSHMRDIFSQFIFLQVPFCLLKLSFFPPSEFFHYINEREALSGEYILIYKMPCPFLIHYKVGISILQGLAFLLPFFFSLALSSP